MTFDDNGNFVDQLHHIHDKIAASLRNMQPFSHPKTRLIFAYIPFRNRAAARYEWPSR